MKTGCQLVDQRIRGHRDSVSSAPALAHKWNNLGRSLAAPQQRWTFPVMPANDPIRVIAGLLLELEVN